MRGGWDPAVNHSGAAATSIKSHAVLRKTIR